MKGIPLERIAERAAAFDNLKPDNMEIGHYCAGCGGHTLIDKTDGVVYHSHDHDHKGHSHEHSHECKHSHADYEHDDHHHEHKGHSHHEHAHKDKHEHPDYGNHTPNHDHKGHNHSDYGHHSHSHDHDHKGHAHHAKEYQKDAHKEIPTDNAPKHELLDAKYASLSLDIPSFTFKTEYISSHSLKGDGFVYSQSNEHNDFTHAYKGLRLEHSMEQLDISQVYKSLRSEQSITQVRPEMNHLGAVVASSMQQEKDVFPTGETREYTLDQEEQDKAYKKKYEREYRNSKYRSREEETGEDEEREQEKKKRKEETVSPFLVEKHILTRKHTKIKEKRGIKRQPFQASKEKKQGKKPKKPGKKKNLF